MAGSSSRANRLRGATVAVFVALGHVARAGAVGEENPRFILDYDAPSGCPDREAFLAALRARTPRPQLTAPSDEKATTIRVVIRLGAGASEGASGQLDLREPDGTSESRRVTSKTCGEVASALSLVAAVMLDPDALAGPPPPLASTPEPAPTPPPPAPPPPPPPRDRSPPRPPVPAEPRTTWQLSAGAQVGVLGGIGPAVAPLGAAFVGVERRSATLISSGRISVDVARTSSDLRGGAQTYEWLGSTVRGCPAHLEVPGLARLRLAPCAGLQVAGYRGTTSNVRLPTSSTQLWVAPLALGVVEWELSSSVALELEGGVVFPLRRSRFFLAPNSTIFEVPAVSAIGALGARINFP